MKGRIILKICLIYMLVVYIMQSTYADSPDQTFIGYQLIEMQPTMLKKGCMILSDSPEQIFENGILYEERTSGEGRLLFHHLNCTNHAKRLIVTMHNLQNKPMKVHLYKKEVVGPTKHILFAGKKILENYFLSQDESLVEIPPLETGILYDSVNLQWQQKEVLTGIMDFLVEGHGCLKVACIDRADALEEITTLSYLQRDCHPRGTFHILEEAYRLHLPSFGKYYMCMEQEEDWVVGKDGITQEITMNKGNYGIMYYVTIQAEADTNVYLVPRAGVFKGVIQWDDGNLCANERTHYFKHFKEPVLLGCVKANHIKSLRYMLPNGSAAPVWLQFEVVNSY